MAKNESTSATVCLVLSSLPEEKLGRVKYPGLLEPITLPDGAWKVVTMDFIDGLPQSATTDLPTPTSTPMKPVEILDKRWHYTPTGRREQILVRWSDPPVIDAIWEDDANLFESYLELLTCGQVSSQGPGVVRTPNATPAQTAAMAAKTAATAANADDGEARRAAMAATGANLEGWCAITRPARLVQPNRRHIGSNWVNYAKTQLTHHLQLLKERRSKGKRHPVNQARTAAAFLFYFLSYSRTTYQIL